MSMPTAPLAEEELLDLYVLHARRLRGGAELTHTARFGDDTWPLAPATLQRHERALVLNFGTVPDRYRLALKRVCYLLLSGPLPLGDPRPAIMTVHGVFYTARLDRQAAMAGPAGRISQVTPADVERYERYLLATFRKPEYRAKHRKSVGYFWRYRQFLGDDALRFDPRAGESLAEHPQRRAADNATDRIPEQVHSRLLVWALRFVDDFSGDIIGAIQHWQQLKGPGRSRSAVGNGRNTGLAHEVRSYLDTFIGEKRPLPGHYGNPNMLAIARELSCCRSSLNRYQPAIAETAAIVGVSEYAQLNIDIAGRLDWRPWIDGICLEPRRDYSLTMLARMLQAACYIVIAFLSGMRDCEKRAELQQMQHSTRLTNGVSAGRRGVRRSRRDVIDGSASTACARPPPPQQCCI